MSRVRLVYVLLIPSIFSMVVMAQAQNQRVVPVKQNASPMVDLPQESISKLIVGSWKIAPNGRSSEGTVTFKADGSYEIDEKLLDGTHVGTKGGYKVNDQTTPAKIDLCLGECGKLGSEWTTRFGIIRSVSNNKLEIHTSPDGKYPTGFSSDPLDAYTLMLTRLN